MTIGLHPISKDVWIAASLSKLTETQKSVDTERWNWDVVLNVSNYTYILLIMSQAHPSLYFMAIRKDNNKKQNAFGISTFDIKKMKST